MWDLDPIQILQEHDFMLNMCFGCTVIWGIDTVLAKGCTGFFRTTVATQKTNACLDTDKMPTGFATGCRVCAKWSACSQWGQSGARRVRFHISIPYTNLGSVRELHAD